VKYNQMYSFFGDKSNKNISLSPKGILGFISFGGLYLCLGGLTPPPCHTWLRPTRELILINSKITALNCIGNETWQTQATEQYNREGKICTNKNKVSKYKMLTTIITIKSCINYTSYNIIVRIWESTTSLLVSWPRWTRHLRSYKMRLLILQC